MKRLLARKQVLSLMIFLLLTIMYGYWLFQHPDRLPLASHWIMAFCQTLLFYYVVLLLTSLLQMLMVGMFHVFPIQICCLYPFTYDGKWRFHPIRMLYQQEGFHSCLYLNLAQYLPCMEVIKQKLKQLLLYRKISYVLTFLFLFGVMHNAHGYTVVMMGIVCSGLIALSYGSVTNCWIGLDGTYHKGMMAIGELLYSGKTISFLDAQAYANILQEGNIRNPYVELAILGNYCYRCLLENTAIIAADIISTKLSSYRHHEAVLTYDLAFDTSLLQVMKLFGWVGIVCKEDRYRTGSIGLLMSLYTDMLQQSTPFFAAHGTKTLRREIAALQSKKVTKAQLHLQDMQAIFAIYETF